MKKVSYILALLLGSAVSLCSCSQDENNTYNENNKALVQIVETGEKIILKDDSLKAYTKGDTIKLSFYSDYFFCSSCNDAKKAVIKKYL